MSGIILVWMVDAEQVVTPSLDLEAEERKSL